MDLEILHKIQDNILIIAPQSDKLDAINASLFKDKILNLIRNTNLSQLVFDLTCVQFIDSSALGAFLVIQRTVNKQGGSVKIANLNKSIQNMFEIASIHRILDTFPSVEEAIKAF